MDERHTTTERGPTGRTDLLLCSQLDRRGCCRAARIERYPGTFREESLPTFELFSIAYNGFDVCDEVNSPDGRLSELSYIEVDFHVFSILHGSTWKRRKWFRMVTIVSVWPSLASHILDIPLAVL
jgi:hypothetical protein